MPETVIQPDLCPAEIGNILTLDFYRLDYLDGTPQRIKYETERYQLTNTHENAPDMRTLDVSRAWGRLLLGHRINDTITLPDDGEGNTVEAVITHIERQEC